MKILAIDSCYQCNRPRCPLKYKGVRIEGTTLTGHCKENIHPDCPLPDGDYVVSEENFKKLNNLLDSWSQLHNVNMSYIEQFIEDSFTPIQEQK